MVAILGLLFAFNCPVGKPEAGIRASRPVKPAVVLRGQNHLLKEDTFCLVNSPDEAKKLLMRASFLNISVVLVTVASHLR